MSREQKKMTGKARGKRVLLQEERFREIYGQEVSLPEELQEKLRIVSCLSYREEQQVYLTEDKNGQKSILKMAQKNQIPMLEKEAEYLKSAPFAFLPQYLSYGKDEAGVWLLKEYVDGDTLWELVERRGPFSAEEADALFLRICAMIGQLHKSEPPIIHRDIKPQNIVLTPEENLFLIDMGTARTFCSGASHDTVLVGTRRSAAPEQYGYRQTDARTDIYALGVLYLYLLTGSMTLRSGAAEQISPQRREIIEVCTRMEPEQRYQDCAQLGEAVRAAGGSVSGKRILKRTRGKMRKYRYGLAALAVLLAAACAFFGGYVSERLPYRFQEELIGQAVRHQLGKSDTETVSKQELRQIEVLQICGDKILETGDRHRQYCGHHYINDEEQAKTTGTVRQLGDLAHMTKLRVLVLDWQQITDVTGLRELPLETVSLCGNPLKDCTALSDIATLKKLELDHTDVNDLAPFARMEALEHLDIGDTGVTRLAPLCELTPLRTLMMAGIVVDDIETLAQMPLEMLVLHSNMTGTEETAGKIKSLKELTIYNYHGEGLEELRELSGLVSLTLYGGTLRSLEGIGKFPLLERLNIGRTFVTDIVPVRELERLQELWIEEVDANDYTPILELKNLKQLGCRVWQEKHVQALTDAPWFEIITTES